VGSAIRCPPERSGPRSWFHASLSFARPNRHRVPVPQDAALWPAEIIATIFRLASSAGDRHTTSVISSELARYETPWSTMLRALIAKQADFEIFNLGGGLRYTVRIP